MMGLPSFCIVVLQMGNCAGVCWGGAAKVSAPRLVVSDGRFLLLRLDAAPISALSMAGQEVRDGEGDKLPMEAVSPGCKHRRAAQQVFPCCGSVLAALLSQRGVLGWKCHSWLQWRKILPVGAIQAP